jgi:hypothetical protein
MQTQQRNPGRNILDRSTFSSISPFSSSSSSPSHPPPQIFLHAKSNNRGDDGENPGDDDGGEELILQDDDWRAFRAKLVMREQKDTAKPGSSSSSLSPSSSSSSASATLSTSAGTAKKSTIVNNIGDAFDELGDLDGIGSVFEDSFVSSKPTETSSTSSSPTSTGRSSSSSSMDASTMTPLDPSQWAYHSGDVIEQGAVILGGVEQDFGFGLRQQYFHKTAILVLDHSSIFTKGIILNRPTDLTLEDDINPGLRWRVWFGGDVQGLKDNHPEIVCLHSLKNEKATSASITVMKDIRWTTFSNAKVCSKDKTSNSREDALCCFYM